jgi:hypothetical protein
MKKLLLLLFIVNCQLSAVNSFAQTNVSGGIFANTTWTLANSPYIVTDTVVVFPGYTLTIEPGVVVKFDTHVQLEIRQGQLIANGTITDSITFTSNATSPYPGVYEGVFVNGGTMTSQVKYCNFLYAAEALRIITPMVTGVTIKHCRVMYNIFGIGTTSPNGLIDSCEIRYNTGMGESSTYNVTHCNISNNYQGVQDGFYVANCTIDSNSYVGVYMNTGTVTNCKFRHDSIGLFNGNPLTVTNCVFTHNDFGIVPSNSTNINHSIIDSNQIGILNGRYGFSFNPHVQNETVSDCEIKYNGIGIYHNPCDNCSSQPPNNTITRNDIENDSIGILLFFRDSIYCNRICNNTAYALKYVGAANTNCVVHNYWCTPDSASTEAMIFDAHDNPSSGIISFMPIDSACSPISTSINENTGNNLPFIIYPNPAHSTFTISLNELKESAELKMYDMTGREVFTTTLNSKLQTLNPNLSNGIYLVRVKEGQKVWQEKLVVE